jgi:HrpA-like RNA helicase
MQLPIHSHKQTILTSIQSHPVIIICGETGSGKTTQIPQYLYHHFQNSCIAITQPRRVAAISIAKRVSLEMNLTLGHQVSLS